METLLQERTAGHKFKIQRNFDTQYNYYIQISLSQDGMEHSRTGLDCGNTPDPYAKAYLIGALNCHRICRNASLNSSLITICWFTPKFECGNSEN